MDLENLIQDVTTELQKARIKTEDVATSITQAFNEYVLKDTPIEDRPFDQNWNDHLMEHFERQMWNSVYTAKQAKKPQGLKR